MDELVGIFLSWQFLLISFLVFLIFGAFNQVLGPYLWHFARLRSALKVVEGTKLLWPPLLGFLLGWVPALPRPEPLAGESQLTVACLFAIAGLGSQWVVKAVKKALESRGIDTGEDAPPREQRRRLAR